MSEKVEERLRDPRIQESEDLNQFSSNGEVHGLLLSAPDVLKDTLIITNPFPITLELGKFPCCQLLRQTGNMS